MSLVNLTICHEKHFFTHEILKTIFKKGSVIYYILILFKQRSGRRELGYNMLKQNIIYRAF